MPPYTLKSIILERTKTGVMAELNGGPSSPASLASVVASPMAPDSHPSDDDDTDCQSLTESITDYPVEWGRTYHRYNADSYLFPNDDVERNRMNLQYDCVKRLHGGKLLLPPIKNPERILDIGTGTGIWPIEVADMFPNARVIGTDLSAIQPAEVPPNVFFEIADCTDDEWGYKLSSFDLIHTGFMLGSLQSFYDLVTMSKRYLKRGTGWLECLELDIGPFCDDGTIPKDWGYAQYTDYLIEASKRVVPPRPMDTAQNIVTWIRQAGYVDVQERVDKMPLNPWPKDPRLKQLGQDWEQHLIQGIAAWSYKLFGERGLGWTRERIEIFLMDVRKAIKDRYVHAYAKIHVVYGRRPSDEEERQMGRMPAPPVNGARGGPP